MKRAGLFAIFALATGCSTEGDRAAQRYENTEKAGGSAHALCKRGNETIEAYLAEGNREKVDHWAAVTRRECGQAELLRGIMPY